MASTGATDMPQVGAVDPPIAARLSHDITAESPTGSISDDEKKVELQDDRTVAALPSTVEKGNVTSDEYVPFDMAKGDPLDMSDMPEELGPVLTIRALTVGTLLGLVVAASNVYLGLKTGFTFAASLFGALLGCAIIKSIVKLPIIGGSFGPRENVTIQTAATASGSLTGMFVAAVPAMYKLGLLSENPMDDFGRLFTFSLVSAFFGVFIAPPFRKFYILRQKLVFPTPSATAFTIKALHSSSADLTIKKKTWALLGSFIASVIFCVVNTYAAGILKDWHVFYWFYKWGWKGAIGGDDWGWIIEWTPAFIGAGMLSGMNASYSYLFGAVLAYGIIGPSLIKTGRAIGVQSTDEPLSFNYLSLKTPDPTQFNGGISPRYWLLWPGIALMLFYSLTELAMSAPQIFRAIKSMVTDAIGQVRHRGGISEKGEMNPADDIYDPVAPEDQVKTWWWATGLLLFAVVNILVCTLQFHMNTGNVILALVLAVLFTTIGVSSAGATDINPISTCAKVSQLIVGGALKAEGRSGPSAQLENLLAGSIASSAASHAVDMLGDLKTGHLLGASPQTQFWAQLVGSLFAVPLSTGMFIIFAKAYPCITSTTTGPEKCAFSLPSVSAWKAVTQAVTENDAITLDAGMTAIGLGIVAMLTVVVRHFWIPQKFWIYVPNWNAVGLAFVTPQLTYPIAMAMGATGAQVLKMKAPVTWDMYGYAVSAGMVAGEGIAGVINAALTIGGVSGDIYGSTVALPNFSY